VPEEERGMFVEVAKPITLLFSILSLYGVFHTAFLLPTTDVEQRLSESLGLLALAAGICLLSGLIFREAPENKDTRCDRLVATLPVQLFCWASTVMLILFLVSWYLESHCIFYRDIRFY
jgi:hypothetical protein